MKRYVFQVDQRHVQLLLLLISLLLFVLGAGAPGTGGGPIT